MECYICIHGHFYQPPRENPWLESIEVQDSASPYHDWNEKITSECYATNATSRILDRQGRIVQIVNNYVRMSFNFGPTLLAWMEKNAPDVYEIILKVDRDSLETFSGHGSAIAQAYNHMILPLANHRDKLTQVLWGIRDFEHRFGRMPEGMWLPETAVDMKTLDILADQGIRFTILAPHQANRVRLIGDKEWQDISGGKIDPTMPYTLHLPSGRNIALFFYDGSISRTVAFEKLLKNGDSFAQRLLSAFSEDRNRPQLVHIATDGETYGHHHRFGDMALAYALNYIESSKLARPTNYGEYLEKYPPTHEVEVDDNTSWSCAHGVERWRSDCGCSTGKHPEWNQGWRKPLREALDWLRDTLAQSYEEKACSFLKDPWEARNSYIKIILDRSPENINKFLSLHETRKLNEAEKIVVLKLLELQRHALLMYTSCGWFFDDISGIETIQIIRYGGRALQLAQEMTGDALEPALLNLLEQARGNVPDSGDGRSIYNKFVKNAMVDLEKVGAHYAMSSLFKEYAGQTNIYCYRVHKESYQVFEAGRARLVLGAARFMSEITTESATLSFGALHFGDHIMNCGVRVYQGKKPYQALLQEISGVFDRGDFPEAIRRMDRHFGDTTYSLKSLFRDEKRKILELVLKSTLTDAGSMYRKLYEHHSALMRFLQDSGVPPPKILYVAAEFVLNTGLRRAFEDGDFDQELIESLLKEAQTEGVTLDASTLEYALRQSLERMARQLLENPTDLSSLNKLEAAVSLLKLLPFRVNLWTVQNIGYDILQSNYPDLSKSAGQGNESAMEWVNHFVALCEKLSVRVA